MISAEFCKQSVLFDDPEDVDISNDTRKADEESSANKSLKRKQTVWNFLTKRSSSNLVRETQSLPFALLPVARAGTSIAGGKHVRQVEFLRCRGKFARRSSPR